MSAKTKEFSLFGVEYKTTQFTAVAALEVMERGEACHPVDNLRLTSAFDPVAKLWVPLTSHDAINTLVFDYFHALPPRMALKGLLKVVNEYSFGFATNWTGVKIPSRFTSGGDVRASNHVDPLISQLLQDEGAKVTLRELEEYYTLEDAFKMFDVMVAKGVNTALAHEAAAKDRKR